jgi:beta-mannanase
MFFVDFETDLTKMDLDGIYNRGMLPVISLEPWHKKELNNDVLLDIKSAKYNGYFDEFFEILNSKKYPIFLRFAHEMNGQWYPWGAISGTQSGANYTSTYRYLFNRYDTNNVYWIWSVNRVDGLKSNVNDFYPGDKFVDLIGISAYSRGQTTPEGLIKKTLNELAEFSEKPIWLTEFGLRNDENSGNWINYYCSLIKTNSLEGIIFFEHKKITDWRVLVKDQAVRTLQKCSFN